MRDPDMTTPAPSAKMSDHDRPPDGAAVSVGRLKRRADFVRAGKGRRWHGKAMSVQDFARPDVAKAAEAPATADHAPRVGFTLTRKVGNSVIRNRARRRLREAVRLGAGLAWQPDHDYVIVGRTDAIRLPFDELTRELDRALRATQGPRANSSTRAGRRPERTRPTP